MKSTTAIWVCAVASTGIAWVAGCASNLPPPNDQWAAAQGDLGRAQEAGAPSVPSARLHLEFAQEDLRKAKELFGHDNMQAQNLCDLASVEAQLALDLTKQAGAERRAAIAEANLQNKANVQ